MRYGAAVDWWSFGILIYEMLNLKTPFYDKNRKLMFHSIINQNPKMVFYVLASNVMAFMSRDRNATHQFTFLHSLSSTFWHTHTQPKEFTIEAKNLILQFLNKDAKKRLGCGEDGAEQIMRHSFFASIEWEALMQRQMKPPFQPDVTNEQDTKYVPSAYLKLEAKDSIVKPTPGGAGASARGNWDEFTYSGESALNKKDDAAAN